MTKAQINMIRRVKNLRAKGASLNEVSKTTHVPKSTVRFWCKDIILTKGQRALLETSRIKGATKRLRLVQVDRRIQINKLREYLEGLGKKDILKFKRNPLYFTGLALYWGEGYKTGNQEVGITNSDPNILLISIKWFNEIYKIKNSELVAKLTINSSYKSEASNVLNYWSKKLKLPLSQFTKTTFITTPFKRVYKNKSHKGTLRIKVLKPIRIRDRILSSIKHLPRFVK